jgi:Phage head completion protein (GPL)
MSFTGKPQTFLETELENDGFFPDISLGELQEVYRVPAEYKQELVEHHTRQAMDDCNEQLLVKKTEWIEEGFESLEDVSDAELGGKPVKIEQYKRAVFNRAMGLMILSFATLNRRAEAENLAKESDDTFQHYMAESRRSIRRILQLPENISVELL